MKGHTSFGMTMTAVRVRSVAVLGATFAVVLALAQACGRDGPPAVEVPDHTHVDVGLTAAETAELRYLSEGSNLVPVDLLRALVDPATGRSFADSLADYGFVPSRASTENPYGLPIGWTTDIPELSPNRLPYVGINCSACHTGRIDYDGRSLLIDGAPNMADIERLGIAIRDAVIAMVEDPGKTLDLVKRLAELRHPEDSAAAVLNIPTDTKKFLRNLKSSVREPGDADVGDADELASAMQDLMRGAPKDQVLRRLGDTIDTLAKGKRERITTIFDLIEKYAPVIENRAQFALRALRAIEISPLAGPGRDDPWGLVRNVLFGVETPLSAPTSIPALFHVAKFDWYHADGNTNSLMQRDVTQAVALGAYVDPATFESTLLIRNIHRLEILWDKVQSPKWPEKILGAIDLDQAARGQTIFQRSCKDCHCSWNAPPPKLEEVGTDRNRAESFARPLEGEPFAERIPAALAPIIKTAFERAGIPEDQEHDYESENPVWRTTRRYVARRLDGIWATAPYLHNGSVPTLYDLLLPAGERPVTFHIGHRAYDPERVGYLTRVPDPVFVLDTTIDGNSNAGHEYGTELNEVDRKALIEYLKTL